MKTKVLIFLLMLLLPSAIWSAENASNVRVQQQGKDIVITYDLHKTSNVRLLMCADGGRYVPLKAVDGSVGYRIGRGNDLRMVWHPLQEMEAFTANNVQFKVEALSMYEAYSKPDGRPTTVLMGEVAYSFAPQLSYGAMFGQTYRGLGWYVDFRSNFRFVSPTDELSCSEGGYINGEMPFYSGNSQTSVLTIHAGFMMNILHFTYGYNNRFNAFGFYVGGGYGAREKLWETTDGKWIEHGPSSSKGFSGNIGLWGSAYGFSIKFGVNTISFKYLELEAGIGWMF